MAGTKRKKNQESKKLVKLKVAKLEHLPAAEPAKSFPLHKLPENVRTKIYSYAGLFRKCPIHLHDPSLGCDADLDESLDEDDSSDFEVRTRRKRRRARYSYPNRRPYSYGYPTMPIPQRCVTPQIEYFTSPEDVFCYCEALPLQLMLVCKAIHEDVEAQFYKSNKFRILKCLDLGLKTLKSLSENAMSHITSLEIVLGKITNSDFRRKGGLSLDLGHIGELIGAKFNLTALAFMFSGDISGLRAQARDTLVESLIPMKGLGMCVLCFGSSKRWHYYRSYKMETSRVYYGDLAQSLVTQLTSKGSQIDPKPFPFYDLPKELRLNVLKHSNLVTIPTPANATGTVEVKDEKIVRQMVCCQKCYAGKPPRPNECYCFGQRSVASSTCTCERSPKDFFLVDKLMSMEALEVFRGANRFHFDDLIQRSIPYLRKQPSDAVRQFKKLDFRYDSNAHYYNTGDAWMDVDPTFWAHWLELGKLLRRSANFSALEISLHFPGHFPCKKSVYNSALFVPGQYLKDWSERAKEAIPVFKGLKCLKIFMNCDCVSEIELEKSIMGESYDSAKYGKLPREDRATWPHLPKKSSDKTINRAAIIRYV